MDATDSPKNNSDGNIGKSKHKKSKEIGLGTEISLDELALPAAHSKSSKKDSHHWKKDRKDRHSDNDNDEQIQDSVAINIPIIRKPGERKQFHQKMFKTPKEIVQAISMAGEKKSQIPLDKLVILGFFAGVYVCFGGAFALIVSQGLPDIAPGFSKLLLGLTFPTALLLIIIAGAELFTGNTMYLVVALLDGRVHWKGLVYNWIVIYISNFAGCVFAGYFFCYLTDIFAIDPWLTNLQHIGEVKTGYGWGVVFLKAIPANWLVCLAVIVAIGAEDMTGKILGCFIPIAAFAAIGYEHCVANMFYVPLALMYGADTTFGKFIYANLIPVTLGNIVGGSIAVGLPMWYLYSWNIDNETEPATTFKPRFHLDKEEVKKRVEQLPPTVRVSCWA